MGALTKKQKEKKSDFKKTKLKVGKTRPKNTNATDTSFAAKSIVLKQQNLGETGRDATALFNHNLSLLSSKSETQRRDALQYLTSACTTIATAKLPQSAAAIIAKAQPLILDGNSAVRGQLLKLFRSLPAAQVGSLDQVLLYTRAGMAHLSNDIKLFALDILDWSIGTNADTVMSCPGGWIKMLRTFQNLLAWQGDTINGVVTHGKWSATKSTSSKLGSNKLLVHQLNTLASFLTAAMTPPPSDPFAEAKRAAQIFPLLETQAHLLPAKSNTFGYLNLFGAVRDLEGEVYADADERIEIFNELGLLEDFRTGTLEAKKEAGEVGRAASGVDKALRLAEIG
ncbi:rRNA processing protein [Recurvomyces mirabilis]|uniref:Pre-rRNA-processing protein n=1 Tax=Recurvomyces mirabilis TaxID=574656 RepID=A0AAE0WK01_9PEZI|nr:rRNA processing protein [Recurvomyces mirabilis]KAK5153348.1 rRNA processing protein [Recurvomyces mirabilis]